MWGQSFQWDPGSRVRLQHYCLSAASPAVFARSVTRKRMLVEHTARSDRHDDAFEAESHSSADSPQSYENVTTMSGNESQTQAPEQPTAGVTHKEETHMSEDFAAALESYTLETEPAPSEDKEETHMSEDFA